MARPIRHRLPAWIGILALGSLAWLAVACNRGPAEEALAAAEQALAAAPDVESWAPEEFAAVSGVLRGARADLAAGRYTEALRAAQALPDRIAAAAKAAAKRKQEAAAALAAQPSPDATPAPPTPAPPIPPTPTQPTPTPPPG